MPRSCSERVQDSLEYFVLDFMEKKRKDYKFLHFCGRETEKLQCDGFSFSISPFWMTYPASRPYLEIRVLTFMAVASDRKSILVFLEKGLFSKEFGEKCRWIFEISLSQILYQVHLHENLKGMH